MDVVFGIVLLAWCRAAQMCVTGGLDSSMISTTECYSGGAWSVNAALPLALPSEGFSALQFGPVACLVGGAYNTSICTNGSGWVPMNGLMDGMKFFATTIYGDGWVGVAGGQDSSAFVSSLTGSFSFSVGPGGTNPSSLAFDWIPRPSLPGSVFGAVPIIINGTPCVVSGYDNTATMYLTNSTCLRRANLQPIPFNVSVFWQPGPRLVGGPSAGRQAATSFEFNGWSCIVGGVSVAFSTLNTTQCLNVSSPLKPPQASTLFSIIPNFNTFPTSISHSVNVTINGLPCLAGGSIDVPTPTAAVWCLNTTTSLDPSNNPSVWEWIPGAALNQPRTGHASFAIQDVQTDSPTRSPTRSPTTITPSTKSPTLSPTKSPTSSPTKSPITVSPTTRAPTFAPTKSPTTSPTTKTPTTRTPTLAPTTSPTTVTPTLSPTTSAPTLSPTTAAPTTGAPTPLIPTTKRPTTLKPTTLRPTTFSPTNSPTTLQPTTRAPTTLAPSSSPTTAPTTEAPTTAFPTTLYSPTAYPTTSPTASPTYAPAWWGVDYSSSVISSQWTTFFLTSSSPSTSWKSSVEWSFSNGLTGKGPLIQLPPFSFLAGENVSFTTGISSESIRSGTLSFSVLTTPIVIVVDGGDRDVPAQSLFTLDASQSYDPDLDTLSSPLAPYLLFQWSLNCQYASLESWTTPACKITIRTGVAESCTAAVNVSSIDPTDNITITKSNQLVVPFRVVASQLIFNISISGPQFIAASDTLRLLASITPFPADAQFAWSITPDFISGSRNEHPECNLPAATASSTVRALTLPPMCLQEGTTYRFMFQVTTPQSSSQAGHTLFTIPIPSGGSCTVSPLVGVALETPFTVECSDWLQPGPVPVALSYSLATKATNVESSGVISPSQAQPSFTFFLSESLVTNLTVSIWGYEGAVVNFDLSMLVVNPPRVCPLTALLASPSEASLNNLTLAFQQLLLDTVASNEPLCDFSSRSQSWVMFWSALRADIESRPAPSPAALSFLAATFNIAVRSIVLISTSNPSSSALVFPNLPWTQADLQEQILDVVNYFTANSQGGTTGSAIAVLAVAPEMFELISGESADFNTSATCARSDRLAVALTQIARAVTSGNLPTDPALSLSPGGISLVSSYFFSDQNSNPIFSDNSEVFVQLPDSLLDQGGEVSAVTVLAQQYKALTNPKCRPTILSNEQLLLASPTIVDITLSTRDGELVPVQTLGSSNNGFSFVLPLADTQMCGGVVCAWWDLRTGTWNKSGCVGSPIPDTPGAYLCTCTHLTEFTLLLRSTACPKQEAGFLTMFALYLVAEVVTLIKIFIRIRADHPRKFGEITILVWEHILIALLCGARALCCFYMGSGSLSQSWSLPTRAAVLILPYLVTFWIYTFLVFQWASVYHFSMKYKNNAFQKVRGLFFGANLVVCAALIALLTTLAAAPSQPASLALASPSSSGSSYKTKVMDGATITLAAATFITSIGFLVYAFALHSSMKNATTDGRSSTTGSHSRCSRKCGKSWNVKTKILVSGVAVSTLLSIEAAMHIVSVAQPRIVLVGSPSHAVTGDASELVVMICDWLAVVVMLATFHKAMHAETTKRNTSPLPVTSKDKTQGIRSAERGVEH